MVDFYPILPAGASLTQALIHLPELLASESVTALRLCLEQIPEDQQAFTRLIALCHQHDVALIIAPASISLLKQLPLGQIDGLHAANIASLQQMLSQSGAKTDMQTGCSCLTLDDAMHAGEQGADYVAFSSTARDALRQWSHMAELPTVAEAVSNADEALSVARAGADFLAFTLKLDGEDATRLAAYRAALAGL